MILWLFLNICNRPFAKGHGKIDIPPSFCYGQLSSCKKPVIAHYIIPYLRQWRNAIIYISLDNPCWYIFLCLAKPRLSTLSSGIQLYNKILHLECSLSKDANPKNISYYWAFCDKDVDNSTCEREKVWKRLQSGKNNTLKLKSDQVEGIRLYRCIADNGIYKDQLKWTIVRPTGKSMVFSWSLK